MGYKIKAPPYPFYIWLDLSHLPPLINSGLVMIEVLLKEKTIVTPSIFFDLNPSYRRNLFSSPTHHFIQISYGPTLEQVLKGLDGMQRVIDEANRCLSEVSLFRLRIRNSLADCSGRTDISEIWEPTWHPTKMTRQPSRASRSALVTSSHRVFRLQDFYTDCECSRYLKRRRRLGALPGDVGLLVAARNGGDGSLLKHDGRDCEPSRSDKSKS